MTTVAINQPSLFTWIGELHKMRLADIVVWLDDAQRQKGGFANRYRMVHAGTCRWITVPCSRSHLSTRIRDLRVTATGSWRIDHDRKLTDWYREAPHRDDMLEMIRRVYSEPDLLSMMVTSAYALFDYLSWPMPELVLSSELGITATKTDRLVEIVESLGASAYLFGPGRKGIANHYLDKSPFEERGVALRLMDYGAERADGDTRNLDKRLSALHLIAWDGAAQIGHGALAQDLT